MQMYWSLADSDNVTYVLSGDLRILITNGAWDRFAVANGGKEWLARTERRASVLDAVTSDLQQFFAAGFAHATRSGERWEHDYECSSPTEFRKYRMIAYPFSGSFLVTHALLVTKPHDDDARLPSDSYEQQGLISMCGHCRRVRRSAEPECWDWVPAYVGGAAQNISHGLCTACYGYYYVDP
jgi:hypothetical protein